MEHKPIILPYAGISPELHDTVFVAPGAAVIGNVKIGRGGNIWFNVTIRGDVNHVRIGTNTNVQDNTCCHVTKDYFPLIIGNDVTIGHGAVVHGCVVGDRCLIGMGATVLDGVIIEDGAMVAAGALVSPGKIIKSGELWAGVPARKIRDLTQEELDYLPWSAGHYVELAEQYRHLP